MYSLHYNNKNGNGKSIVQKSQKKVEKIVKMHESSKKQQKGQVDF